MKKIAAPFTLNATTGTPTTNIYYGAYSPPTRGNNKSLELFLNRLDQDQDGSLSADEFDAGTRLLKLDVNEDGTISKNELAAVAGGNANQYVFAQMRTSQQTSNKAPILQMPVDDRTMEITVRRLLRKYAKRA